MEHPKKLAALAKASGMRGIGIADTNIYAWPMLERAAAELNIQPVFGTRMEIDFAGEATLLAETEEGFKNLAGLSGVRRSLEEVQQKSSGLIAVAPPLAYEQLAWKWDPQKIFLEINNFSDQQSHSEIRERVILAKNWQAKLAASNRVWTGLPADNDVTISEILKLNANRENLPVRTMAMLPKLRENHYAYKAFGEMAQKRGIITRPNHPEGWLKPAKQMRQLFKEIPEAADNTLVIAEMCQPRQLPEVKIPAYPTPEGMSAGELLRNTCEQQLKESFNGRVPKSYRERLSYELERIGEKNFADYFLIIADVIAEARRREIDLSDMGSATGSLVCRLLGITQIDPVKEGLSFDRFLGPNTTKVPDIDHGVDGIKPEEFRDAAYETGRSLGIRSYRIATFKHFQYRSALKTVMTAFGFGPTEIKKVAEMVKEKINLDDAYEPLSRLASEIRNRRLFSGEVGTHGSKVVMSREKIGRSGIAADKDLGGTFRAGIDKNKAETMVNIDGVSNYGLSQKRMMRERVGVIGFIPDETAVLRMIFEGKGLGIPFIETPWLLKVTENLAIATPDKQFSRDDIVLLLALSRPGVWTGMGKYLNRRLGTETANPDHPIINKILGSTLGAVVFQDQALHLAGELGKLSPEDRETFRRAISKNRDPRMMDSLRRKFLTGAAENGIPAAEAVKWWREIAHFTEYGFLKGHAIALEKDIVWPLSVYKYYFPKEFMEVLFRLGRNHYFVHKNPEIYIAEAKRLGVRI